MAETPEESKKLKAVVKIDPSKVRKSTGRQFLDSFITHDFDIVRDYLFNDILIPAIKNTIVDTICSAVNMIFKGSPSSSSNRSWNSDPNRRDYGSIYRTSDTGIFRREEQRPYEYKYNRLDSRRSTIAYMDIPFNSRSDAEEILDILKGNIDKYERVSVADFYDLVDYPYNNFELHNWGWTNLNDVIVTWSHGVWIIDLPSAIPIK